MAKLWDKGQKLDAVVEAFCTGRDPILDKNLVYHDCMGTIAHTQMLAKIGILSNVEFMPVKGVLVDIIKQDALGNFVIKQTDEDVHTAVENYVTQHLGDLGKKIHTARSRNDQVMLDIRLYQRDQIIEIIDHALTLCDVLLTMAQQNATVPMPGRTHFQRAMPSSVGLWAGAFLESLLDDVTLLSTAYDLINQCPLGSAASYGVALPIDRQYVADLLGFAKVQNNVLYVNNSRGKFEAVVLNALTQVMIDLSKLSSDVIVFSAPEFGYFTLPEEFCFGSSLMPQKRNPCPFELIRAKSATMISYLMQTLEIIRMLPSGYNRDFQETKYPMMQGFTCASQAVRVCGQILAKITINKEACVQSFTHEIFATDQLLKLVESGVPFRDAYKQVGQNIASVAMIDPVQNIMSKTHLGATGNLGLEISEEKIKTWKQWANDKHVHLRKVFATLIE